MLDNHPGHPRLNTSPPNIVYESTPARIPKPVKSVPEMVLPISRPLFSPGTHVKAGKRSKHTVLSTREPPKGNSRIGNLKSSSRAVLAPFLKRRDVEKQSIRKAEVSITKGTTSAVKHLPAYKTASSLSKPSPVITLSTQASPTRPSNDKTSPPFPAVSKRCASSVISTNNVVNIDTTHRLSETLPRVSNGSFSPSSGENTSSPVAGEAKQIVETQGEPSNSPQIRERSAERFTQSQRLVGKRVMTLSFSDEVEEKRRIYDTVVNIQINRNEEIDSPEDTAASTLPFSTSVPSSICPAPTVITHPSSDEPSPLLRWYPNDVP